MSTNKGSCHPSRLPNQAVRFQACADMLACSCPCLQHSGGSHLTFLDTIVSPHQVAEEKRQQREGCGGVSEQRQQGVVDRWI